MAKSIVAEKIAEDQQVKWVIKGYTKPHTQTLLQAGATWEAGKVRWVYEGESLPAAIRDAIANVNRLESLSPMGETKAGQGKKQAKKPAPEMQRSDSPFKSSGMGKVTPLREQYLSIKAQYRNCILFFRLGDFYETFDEDAEIAARELDLVLTARPVSKSQRVPMAGVPHYALEGYIATLLEKGYPVAVCEQVSEPMGSGVVERKVVRVERPAVQSHSDTPFVIGDKVTVGNSDVVGEVVAVGDPTRYEGKVCVTRPNPNGGVNMTHWVKVEKVKRLQYQGYETGEFPDYEWGSEPRQVFIKQAPPPIPPVPNDEAVNSTVVACPCGWSGAYEDPTEATLALGVHFAQCGKGDLPLGHIKKDAIVKNRTGKLGKVVEDQKGGLVRVMPLDERGQLPVVRGRAVDWPVDFVTVVDSTHEAVNEATGTRPDFELQAKVVQAELISALKRFKPARGKNIRLTITKGAGKISFSDIDTERFQTTVNAILEFNASRDTVTLETSLYALLDSVETMNDDVIKLTYRQGRGLNVDRRSTNGVHTLWCKLTREAWSPK